MHYAEQIEQNQYDKNCGRRIQHNLGKGAPRFMGRNLELDRLRKAYDDGLTPAFIHGPPGYGKTELATWFARSVKDENNINVIMLYGDSDEKLKDSLRQLYKELTEKAFPVQKNILDCVTSLNSIYGRVILIIDNVDSRSDFFDALLTRLKEKTQCFVVVTTRDVSAIGYASVTDIPLDVFPRTVSIQFVNDRLANQEEDKVNKLCEELGDWPLALVQATAFIKNSWYCHFKGQSYKINTYLEELKNRPERFLLGNVHQRGQTLSKTLEVSIIRIETDRDVAVAKNVLSILSYIDPNGIHVDILVKYYQHCFSESETTVRYGIRLLQSYSLIRMDDDVIFIHRLSQQIIQLRQNNDGDGLEESILSKLVKLLDGVKGKFCADEKFHIAGIWEHAVRREGAKGYSRVPVAVSDRLIDLSFFEIAYKFCKNNVELMQPTCCAAEDILRLEYNIARSLNYLGLASESEDQFRFVKEKIQQFPYPTKIEDLVFEVKLEMASWHLKNGDLSKACKKYSKIHESCSKLFGQQNSITVRAKHGIAICKKDLGEKRDALGLFYDVLSMRRSLCGENDPSYLRTLCFIGQCKYEMNDREGCREEFKKALKLQYESPSSFHPEHDLVEKSVYYMAKSFEGKVEPKRLKTVLVQSVGSEKLAKKFVFKAVKNAAFKLVAESEVEVKLNLLQVAELLMMEMDEEEDQKLIKNEIKLIKDKLEKNVGQEL